LFATAVGPQQRELPNRRVLYDCDRENSKKGVRLSRNASCRGDLALVLAMQLWVNAGLAKIDTSGPVLLLK
jgi:hypothetical protein